MFLIQLAMNPIPKEAACCNSATAELAAMMFLLSPWHAWQCASGIGFVGCGVVVGVQD